MQSPAVDVSGSSTKHASTLHTSKANKQVMHSLGGIIQGTTYYVKTTDINTQTFTISATTTNGVADAESSHSASDTGAMNVTQWEQTNVDRLWVTVNGARVPSDRLRLGADNEVSISNSNCAW